jgi:hypothetical protein
LGAGQAGAPASAADAQDRLGGHFGVVFPMVMHVNGNTVGIGDDRYAFDLEFVPVIDPREGGPVNVTLTVQGAIRLPLQNVRTCHAFGYAD